MAALAAAPVDPAELLTEQSAAQMLGRVSEIAAENDELRAQNAELLQTQLALLQASACTRNKRLVSSLLHAIKCMWDIERVGG